VIPFIDLPLILNRLVFLDIIKISEAAVNITKKAHTVIASDNSLKKLSGYSDTCFLLASDKYHNTRSLPEITRVDICLTDAKINIFEINTDSPGGMHHLDRLVQKQKEFLNEIGLSEKIDLDLEIFDRKEKDLCSSIIAALRECWKDFNDKKSTNQELKTIAIVEKDWKKQPTKTEFEHFKVLLKGENYTTGIYEPDELDYINGSLIVKKTEEKIDLVYKRVLWNDLLERNQTELEINDIPLIAAYKDNNVCMVNSLNSWLAGNKLSLALMKDSAFKEKLKENKISLTQFEDEVVNENIPETYRWDKESVNKTKILNSLDQYIIKSFTGYGAKQFITGRNDAETKKAFDEEFNKKWILQKKIDHGRFIIPIKINKETYWRNWSFIVGAYVINGKCVALEAKFAEKPPITMNYDEHNNPVGYRTAVFPTLN
jgi:hypothetical protein